MKLSGIDHVAHKVDNIPDAVKWYQLNLDAEVEYQDETWAMLSVAGSKLALSKNEHPNHVAFTVPTPEDLPKTAHMGTHRDGSQYSYARDPYGNFIEFIYWPERSVKLCLDPLAK